MNQPPPALIKTSTHSNQVNLVKPSSSPYLNSKPNHSIHPSTSTLNSQSIHPIQEDPTAPSNHRFYNRFNLSSLQCSILALLGLQSIAIISILSSTVSKIRKEIQLDTPQLTTVSTYLVSRSPLISSHQLTYPLFLLFFLGHLYHCQCLFYSHGQSHSRSSSLDPLQRSPITHNPHHLHL